MKLPASQPVTDRLFNRFVNNEFTKTTTLAAVMRVFLFLLASQQKTEFLSSFFDLHAVIKASNGPKLRPDKASYQNKQSKP